MRAALAALLKTIPLPYINNLGMLAALLIERLPASSPPLTAEPNIEADCPACERRTSNLAVHVHTHHGPAGHAPEHRTGDIVLLVIRRPADGKFLMVQEFGALGFWLPGGGVDEGEVAC